MEDQAVKLYSKWGGTRCAGKGTAACQARVELRDVPIQGALADARASVARWLEWYEALPWWRRLWQF